MKLFCSIFLLVLGGCTTLYAGQTEDDYVPQQIGSSFAIGPPIRGYSSVNQLFISDIRSSVNVALK